MKKGQVSIDLLLALFVAIIFFGMLVAYADSFSENARQVEEQSKMKAVLMDVYSSMGAVKAHNESGFSIAYNAPTYAECTIEINPVANGSIKVTSTKDPAIKAEYTGLDLTGIGVSSPINCGDTGKVISKEI